MNFRLAELARRFTDIITHLTEQPFTWGAGTGDIEDQADLVGALGEKADKENTYTKQESDDLLDGKFDKSGGTIEGIVRIENDSPDGLEIVRTGSNAGRARLRVVGTGSSGLSPELLISGDQASETPGLPLYVPGRISTRDGFYIGSTRKDQEWDAKADQTALDDTNQAVDDLDGRVGTAEDDIQALEEGKANVNNPIFSGAIGIRSELDKIINRHLMNIPGSHGGGFVVELGTGTGIVDVTGVIEGAGTFGNVRNSMRCEFTLVLNSEHTRFVSVGAHNSLYSCRPVSYTRDGETRRGIQFFGTSGNWYPTRIWFSGVVGQGQEIPNGYTNDQVTNIQPISYDNQFVLDVTGPIKTTGTVTADDFITTSRVESDRANALAALDNISEWKKKDGTIDYKKHYAYTPQVVRDEKGEVIEEKPGLSMEKRVAMLEKMIHELSTELNNVKTQRK